MRGNVYSIQGKYHRIKAEDGSFYQGTLSRSLPDQNETIIAVGDWVEFRVHSENDAVIDQIYPRHNKLSRLVSLRKKQMVQVMASNLDQLVIVSSVADPAFKPGLVDRYLILALRESIPVILIINKSDLKSDLSLITSKIQYYSDTIPVILCSALTGENLETVRSVFTGTISVLAGHSGVGKSSILNALVPEANMKVMPLRGKSGKGRHTTTFSVGFDVSGGGVVFDTPGIRKFSLEPIESSEIQWYFPDFADYSMACRFANCLHTDEPHCAVKEAVKSNKISLFRYQSYCRLVNESDSLIRPAGEYKKN